MIRAIILTILILACSPLAHATEDPLKFVRFRNYGYGANQVVPNYRREFVESTGATPSTVLPRITHHWYGDTIDVRFVPPPPTPITVILGEKSVCAVCGIIRFRVILISPQ